MEKMFEELDYRRTERGELILRRRKVPTLRDAIVYEVILNEEFLMSSLFHAAEDALAHLPIRQLAGRGPLDILVGGLGLGYTAAAALEHDAVASLQVVEIFPEIIDWHRQGLLPLKDRLVRDPRCNLVEADFFAGIAAGEGSDAGTFGRQYHAILLDIDHTPEHWLYPAHAAFYSNSGLAGVQQFLQPGGLFALWADGHPDDAFLKRLQAVFVRARAETIRFSNPFTGDDSAGTVYIAETD